MDRLYPIARQARSFAERYAAKYKMANSLAGVCAVASAWILRRCIERGIRASILMTEVDGSLHHCYVLSHGWMVDVTATQFRAGADMIEQKIIIQRAETLFNLNPEHYWFWTNYWASFDTVGELTALQQRDCWYPNQIAYPGALE